MQAGKNQGDRSVGAHGGQAIFATRSFRLGERDDRQGTGKELAGVAMDEETQIDIFLAAAREGDLARVKEMIQSGTDVNGKDDYGDTALMTAAENGHLRVIRHLAHDHHADVNAENTEGSTALIIAAERGHVEVVRYLAAQHQVDVNVSSDSGETPLMCAVECAHLGVVRCLAEEHNVDVKMKDEYGNTALMRAAGNGSLDLVRYLVGEQHANVNEKSNCGYTALMRAAESGHLEMVRFLADNHYADVYARSTDGYTALMRASACGHVDVVRFLVEEHYADVNMKGKDKYTALMRSAERGHIEVVRYLADEHRVDVNAKAKDGYTALTRAAESGYLEVVQYLVENHRVNVNSKTNDGDTALMSAASNGYLDVVRYLAERNRGDINLKNKYGDTALMRAAGNGHLDVVRYVADGLHADVNVKTKYGGTALTFAANNEHWEVVRYLAHNHHTDVNATIYDGDTALIRAAATGHLAMVLYLAGECHAKVNVKGNDGYTALMRAAERGHLKMVQYLAGKHRADVNIKNDFGSTALMGAAKGGSVGIIRYLADEHHAAVDVQDNNGNTALLIAAERGHCDLVKYLAGERHADVNGINNNGCTALMNAVWCGHLAVTRYLTSEHHADINLKNDNGCTALMGAAEWGYLDVVQCLTDGHHADVNVKDKKEYTALMRAAKNNHWDVVLYLVDELHADVNVINSNGESAIGYAVSQGNHDMLQLLTRFAKMPAELPPQSGSTKVLAIPPNELAFTQLVQSGNVGGDFLAKWLDADVVVKLFIPTATQSSFHEEAHVWQQLRHPNIIKMYGACVVDRVPGLQLFVYEYASGGSLLEYVRHNYADDMNPVIWKYLHEAALGLAYLHERKIIHGDLRCSNILIGSDGLSKLSNFGLSGPLARDMFSSKVGAKRWVAPEVLKGGTPSFASDVYSLGLCVLEAATGEPPWAHENEEGALLFKEAFAPERDSRILRRNKSTFLPDDGRELVWRMCSQNPRKRISISSITSELHRYSISRLPVNDSVVTLDMYKCGQAQEMWTTVVNSMEHCSDNLYQNKFKYLKQLHERILNSPHPESVLQQFHSLLIEFRTAISMTPDQALAMRLSSTRAAATSAISFHRRIQSLWRSLGETVQTAEVREQQWDEQQRDVFMIGVSDLYLRLNDLGSDEERLALIETLKTETELYGSKYTRAQLNSMKKMIKAVESKLEKESSSSLIPEWFIPWYELVVDELRPLGSGGFGNVYRAKWLDSDVVVKRLAEGEDDAGMPAWSILSSVNTNAARNSTTRAKDLAAFRHEVDIWYTFRHPHVIQLFGACHVGKPFFVCEYATNGTLISYLKEHPDELWEKLHDAALGVQYLHARSVVHGDLKGNNIVVGSDKKAKVTDFGLSSLMSETGSRQISAASHWVAPECFEAGGQPTFASDIYSLGMCIVEVMRVVEAARTGNDTWFCLPWIDLPNEVVRVHAKKGRLPPRPNICKDDDSHWDLVKQMCASDPTKRMKISTVVDELERLLIKQVVKDPLKSSPNTIFSAREILATLHDSQHELPLYMELWDRIESVLSHCEDKITSNSRTTLYSVVADANEATKTLSSDKKLVSVASRTMRCYELHRRLDKFLEAFQLQGYVLRRAPRTIVGVYHNYGTAKQGRLDVETPGHYLADRRPNYDNTFCCQPTCAMPVFQ